MKGLTKLVVLLVSHILVICPALEPLAQEGAAGPPEEGAHVVVLSELVGEEIDREERDQCRLFLFAPDFESAVVYRLRDGSHVVQIVEDKEGVKLTRRRPLSRAEMDELRQVIGNRMGWVGQEGAPEPADGSKIVVVSERVGEVIDREERDICKLFPFAPDFESAVVFQLPDGGHLLQIVEDGSGVRKTRVLAIEERDLVHLRTVIDHQLGPAPMPAEAFAEEALSIPEDWELVVLSEKVGEMIDKVERDYYRLFPFAEGFRCAAVFRRPDSSYVIRFAVERDGAMEHAIMSIGDEVLAKYRHCIDSFGSLGAVSKWRFKEWQQDLKEARLAEAVADARQRAALADTVKWAKKRWREESRSDWGGTYRGGGSLLGFTLGATAGMLIGKGFQGKKLERTEPKPNGWGHVKYYSYDNRFAPHLAGVAGGAAGALAGYWLGKRADKTYYSLVPTEIRTAETRTSSRANFFFGFGVVGPVVGEIARRALYAPTSVKTGGGWIEFPEGTHVLIGAWIVGGLTGAAMLDAYTHRAKHNRLWEESLIYEEPEASLDIDVFPMDPTAFGVHAVRLPGGKTVYEYRMDMVRICF